MRISGEKIVDVTLSVTHGVSLIATALKIGAQLPLEITLGLGSYTIGTVWVAAQIAERILEYMLPVRVDGLASALSKWTFAVLYAVGNSALVIKGLGLSSSLTAGALLVSKASLAILGVGTGILILGWSVRLLLSEQGEGEWLRRNRMTELQEQVVRIRRDRMLGNALSICTLILLR